MCDPFYRRRCTIAALAVVALFLGLSAPAPAFQDEKAADEAAPAADAPAADAPAEGDGADGGAAADGGDGAATEETDAPAPESFLEMLVRANGWLFGPIFLCMSVMLVALVLINTMQIRRENLLPTAFVEDFEQKLSGKDYQGAYEIARSDDSFVARVLAAGLAKLNRGYPEAVEGMQEVGEEENMTLEHRLSYLALIGTVAPMMGLLGTVWGMVAAFQVIATSATQPKPSQLADGISTALVTTLEGLIIAIPAMIAYSLLRNRAARFVLEVGIVSEGLMQRFGSLGKSKSGGSSPPADV